MLTNSPFGVNLQHVMSGAALFFFLSIPLFVAGQQITEVGTRWNDSFREWVLYEEGEEAGYLRPIWEIDNIWSAWEYSAGERYGTIKLKWKDNPNEWELRGDNVIITARTVWNDNLLEWRISDGNCTITIRSRFGNLLEDWESRSSNCGNWNTYTIYEGDPRDWAIEEALYEEGAFHLSLMATFIAIFHSTPKE